MCQHLATPVSYEYITHVRVNLLRYAELEIEDHCLPFTIRCKNHIFVAFAYWLPLPLTPVSFIPHSLHNLSLY